MANGADSYVSIGTSVALGNPTGINLKGGTTAAIAIEGASLNVVVDADK
jgi:hypothetical protein